MHIYYNNYWPLNKEQRICFQTPTPRSGFRPNTLNEHSQNHSKESGFHAEVVSIAQELDINEEDLPYLTNDRLWRDAWTTFSLYNDPINATVWIIDPITFLKRISPQKRMKLLKIYIDTHFVYSFKKPPLLKQGVKNLRDAKPEDIAGDDGLKRTLYSLMAIEDEMRNGDGSEHRNLTFFANAKEIREHAVRELKERYKNKDQAFRDFCRTLERHPELQGGAIISDPIIFFDVIKDDKTPFAAALRSKVEGMDEIFSEENLKQMIEKWYKRKHERQSALQSSVQNQREVVDEILERNRQPFAEKIKENWDNLSSGSKWMTVAFATTYAYLRISGKFGKSEKAGKVRGALWKTLGLAEFSSLAFVGMYFTGARQMLNNTRIGDFMSSVEGTATNIIYAEEIPNFDEKHLKVYAELIDGMVGDEAKTQVEAMGYMSEIPLSAVVGCFTLSSNSKTGEFNIDDSSSIGRAIKTAFPNKEQANDAIRTLKKVKGSGENSLGDAFPSICMLLAATKNQKLYREAEDLRIAGGYKTYDQIPEGHAALGLYQELVIRGLEIATSDYADKSFYEVVTMLMRGTEGLGDQEWTEGLEEKALFSDVHKLPTGEVRVILRRFDSSSHYVHTIKRKYIIDKPVVAGGIGGTTREVIKFTNEIMPAGTPETKIDIDPNNETVLVGGEKVVAIHFEIITKKDGEEHTIYKDKVIRFD